MPRLPGPALSGPVLPGLALALSLGLAAPATAAPCGGDFAAFVEGLKAEALAAGQPRATVDAFFRGARQDRKVLGADRAQGFFQKDFIDFARTVISEYRLVTGQRKARELAETFARVQRDTGVSPGILLAFWALETDYGGFQGDFNTRDALVTLAHDCRRPQLFRPQVLAAIELFRRGDFDPETTTGAWAGEIGMVQMLPRDILDHGADGDGDGHVRLKTSAPDALLSGARMLRALGWRPNEPWLQEVILPDTLDWSQTGIDTALPVADWARMGVRARSGDLPRGLRASVVIPMGRKGPAFLAYPNFRVLFEWNQSFTYVTTAAYFATRLEGAPVFDPGNPDPGLSGEEMKELQRRLAARGHDVGGIDGILGAGTRAAVQAEQARLGLPADAWPTRALLDRLR